MGVPQTEVDHCTAVAEVARQAHQRQRELHPPTRISELGNGVLDAIATGFQALQDFGTAIIRLSR